jgi:transcriptional regulator with XRE-family HTH domain
MTPLRLRLVELRTRRGWSQAELGRRAGVAAAIISRTERGETTPSLATLDKLAKGLGVSPRSLIG